MQKILLLFFLIIQSLISQKLQFQRIGMADGLPQSTVSDILQDREGFLWFGTWDGLVRYDGYSYLTFRSDPNDSTTLSNNNVRGLFRDSSGYIWAMTQQGLNRFHPRVWTVKQFLPNADDQFSIPSLSVYSMMQGIGGKIWLGTTAGFSMYDTALQRFTNYVIPRINTSQGKWSTVYGIVQENKDKLWMGTLDGLLHYDLRSKTFDVYPFKDVDGKFYGVQEPLQDATGLFWCTSTNGKVVVFNPKTKTFIVPVYNNKYLSCEYVVHHSYRDIDNSLWFVSYAKLMHIKFQSVPNGNILIQEYEEYRHDPADNTSLNTVSLLSFFKDNSGVIWVGSSSGLNKSIPQRKIFFSFGLAQTKIDSFPAVEIVGIQQTGNDSLWIGTREGLFLLGRKNATYKVIGEYFNIPKTTILSLFNDNEGKLLVGSREGLFVWNPAKKKFDHKNIYPTTANNYWRIYSFLYMDHALWIGTSDGLFKSTDRKYERFEQIQIESAATNTIPVLHLVKGNLPHTILVCSNANGMFRYQTQKKQFVQKYPCIKGNLQTLNHSIVMHAYEDSNNTIWVATYGGGLNKITELDGKITYQYYQEKDGLINNNLYCVLPDHRGNLWMSSNKGISKFDPRKEKFYNYNMLDGLPTDEFNQNSFFVNDIGKMFFGGISGFVEFYPEEIQENRTIPQLAITDFRIFEQPRNELLQYKEIELQYDENFLSFEFSSLCYDAPQKNRYAYRLLGVTDRWTYTDVRRYASFTNLSSGRYVFQVKGTNNDGVWNEEGASLKIIIYPPWWGTWWFRSVSVLFFIGIIVGGVWLVSRRKYQHRIRELEQQKLIIEERQKTREQIAQDLHDDVATTISSISLYAEMIHHRTKKRRSDLENAIEKISLLSSNAKQSMEEVVWSLSPQHDTLDNLVNRIGDVAAQWCNDHSIQCHLAFCIIPPDILISEDLRKNVYLIFKEAMNNIIKHSGAGSVELISWYENGLFYLTIRDDGKGIGTERTKGNTIGGNGLVNMRARAKSVGAEFTIDSQKNKGTSISVVFKIAQLRH